MQHRDVEVELVKVFITQIQIEANHENLHHKENIFENKDRPEVYNIKYHFPKT